MQFKLPRPMACFSKGVWCSFFVLLAPCLNKMICHSSKRIKVCPARPVASLGSRIKRRLWLQSKRRNAEGGCVLLWAAVFGAPPLLADENPRWIKCWDLQFEHLTFGVDLLWESIYRNIIKKQKKPRWIWPSSTCWSLSCRPAAIREW